MGEATQKGPKSLLRRPFRNSRHAERDSDEEPLLPHEHNRADVQSAASTGFAEEPHSWRTWPILSARRWVFDPAPSSGSDVDDEAVDDVELHVFVQFRT